MIEECSLVLSQNFYHAFSSFSFPNNISGHTDFQLKVWLQILKEVDEFEQSWYTGSSIKL